MGKAFDALGEKEKQIVRLWASDEYETRLLRMRQGLSTLPLRDTRERWIDARCEGLASRAELLRIILESN